MQYWYTQQAVVDDNDTTIVVVVVVVVVVVDGVGTATAGVGNVDERKRHIQHIW